MKDYIHDSVTEFHAKFGHHMPERPTLDSYPFELRTRLIVEEAIEFAQACGFDCFVVPSITSSNGFEIKLRHTGRFAWYQMIDACIDLFYVTSGALVSMGFDAVQVRLFFDEVHRANMRKSMKKDEKSTPGKTLKPERWEPPKIYEALKAILASYVD